MSRPSPLWHVLVLVCLTAGASPVFAADPPTFPPGKDLASPKPLKRPNSVVAWQGVIGRDVPTLYKSFEGDEVYPAPALKFGDSAFVVHAHEGVGQKPSRYLLAKFEGEIGFGGKDAKFESWIGWIDPNYVVDEITPLKVKPTREALLKSVPKTHQYFDRIQKAFPDAASPDFPNVTLKAITHPERGKACFLRPVPPEQYAKMVKSDQAIALQPFAFFYVYAIAVEPKNVHCLLGPRATISLNEGDLGEKFRNQLLGWVELDSLMLWTTREAFEFHLEKPVLESRCKTNRPIELFASSKDLKDWAAWELDGRKGKNPVQPIYTEELDPTKAPAWMQKTWDGRWMRYPILSSYPIQPPGNSQPASIVGRWLGYQLLVSTHSNPTMKGKINQPSGVSQLAFSEAHSVAQIPGETENLARLRRCVLLSDTEFLSILVVTQFLLEGLSEELKKKGNFPNDEPVEKTKAKIKDMVIRVMLVAFGEDVDPARIAELTKKPFDEIQKEVNQLAVQFNVLQTQPATIADLKKLIEQLKAKGEILREINNSQRSTRMFKTGVATGEPHVWLYKHELP